MESSTPETVSKLMAFALANHTSSSSTITPSSIPEDSSPVNVTFTLPSRRGGCQVGAMVPSQPSDLSFLQYYPAPSQPRQVPSWEMGLKIFFYVLAFLMAVTGNIVAILIICLHKKMRSTTNLLLLNQAVSDLLVAALCMWVHLGNNLAAEWPFGPSVCKVNTFCQVVAVMASVLTLTAISVERFIAIVYPFKGRWRPRTTGLVIAGTWITAASFASPHLFVRSMFQRRWKDRNEVWCAEAWQQVYRNAQCDVWEPGKVVYYCLEGIVMYFVPVLIMMLTYSIITFTLIKRKVPGILVSTSVAIQEKAKRKVVKMLVAMVVCFVLCWTPQQCLLLYDVFMEQHPVPEYISTLKYLALYVAYFNSALNPILFGGFNDNFRSGFHEACLFLLGKKNKVHPEGADNQAGLRLGEDTAGRGQRPAARGTSSTSHVNHQAQTSTTPGISVPSVHHRPHITEEVRTRAVFAEPSISRQADRGPSDSLSVLSEDTTTIAWEALH